MVHEMKLRNIPFEKIKTKEKTIELRLLDKKRSKIRIGDTIRFPLVENNNESINTKVINLYFADSFPKLFKEIPLNKCGIENVEKQRNNPINMREYYSQEELLKYRVVGIEIELI